MSVEYPETRKKLAVNEYMIGKSARDVAEQFDVSEETIVNWVHKYGEIRKRGYSDTFKRQVVSEFRTTDKGIIEIAEEFRISPNTLGHWLGSGEYEAKPKKKQITLVIKDKPKFHRVSSSSGYYK